jgi:hypothetical protein
MVGPLRNFAREGRVVEARKLIREAAFNPEQLEIITTAFDRAWEAIQDRFDNDAERRFARLKLAETILARASAGMMEPALLQASAVEAMRAPPD